MHDPAERGRGELLLLGVLAIGSGAVTGVMVSAFKLSLAAATQLRAGALDAAHQIGPAGALVTVAGAAAAMAAAGWLVARYSIYASGSGVPEVEAALSGELPPAPLRRILLIKFVGGILSIGAGAALGPEGPGVQMGAVSARLLAGVFRRAWPDTQALVAAGAGAGIAVAFNAPIAGAVFVLEELTRRFDTRVAIAGLGASSAAIFVSRLLLGDATVLHVAVSVHPASAVGPLPYAAAASLPLYLLAGIFVGFAAVLYNRLIRGSLRIASSLDKWPAATRAAAVGATIGVVAWLAPALVGDGTELSQFALSGSSVTVWLLVAIAARAILGPLSYAARTPGGLFAPLLAVGALLGSLWGGLMQMMLPTLAIEPQAFAVAGMAAMFTGVVRAPVTAVVLVIEMTAAFTVLLPMLVACFAAMLTASLLNEAPIYEFLRKRLIGELQLARPPSAAAAHIPPPPLT